MGNLAWILCPYTLQMASKFIYYSISMQMLNNWTRIPDASADIPRSYNVLITVCRQNVHYVAEDLLLLLELLRHLVCHPMLF